MKTIYEAEDGKHFSTKEACQVYENKLKAQLFSFRENTILDENGKRMIPEDDPDYSVERALDGAFYLGFKDAKARLQFARLSETASKYNNSSVEEYPKKYLRFVWSNQRWGFMPIDLLLEQYNRATKFLDAAKNKNTDNPVTPPEQGGLTKD